MLHSKEFYGLSEPTKLRWPNLPNWLYLMIVASVAMASVLAAQIVGFSVLGAVVGLDELMQAVGGGNTSARLLTAVLILGFLPIFGLVWLWLRLFEKRGFASVGMPLTGAFRHYVRGVLVGLAMLGGAVGLMSLLGYTAIEAPFRGASVARGVFSVGWLDCARRCRRGFDPRICAANFRPNRWFDRWYIRFSPAFYRLTRRQRQREPHPLY